MPQEDIKNAEEYPKRFLLPADEWGQQILNRIRRAVCTIKQERRNIVACCLYGSFVHARPWENKPDELSDIDGILFEDISDQSEKEMRIVELRKKCAAGELSDEEEKELFGEEFEYDNEFSSVDVEVGMHKVPISDGLLVEGVQVLRNYSGNTDDREHRNLYSLYTSLLRGIFFLEIGGNGIVPFRRKLIELLSQENNGGEMWQFLMTDLKNFEQDKQIRRNTGHYPMTIAEAAKQLDQWENAG